MKLYKLTKKELLVEMRSRHMEDLKKNTVQIFITNSIDGVKPLGTGIFFRFENNYFMLTADHLLRGENINELRLRIVDEFIPLPNAKIYHTNSNENEEFDKYDIAAVEFIGQSTIRFIEREMNFIELKDIQFNSTQKMSNKVNLTHNDYAWFGFPGRATQNNGKEEFNFHVKPYLMVGGLNKRNIRKIIELGYDCHYFINKMKKANNFDSGARMNIRNLKGMSGGGLWEMNHLDTVTGETRLKLIGILIRETADLYIFTKIDLVIEMIRDLSDLKKLPKPIEKKRNTGSNMVR